MQHLCYFRSVCLPGCPILKLIFWLRISAPNYNPEVGYAPHAISADSTGSLLQLLSQVKVRINNHGPGTDIDIIGNDLYGTYGLGCKPMVQNYFSKFGSVFHARYGVTTDLAFFAFDPTFPGCLQPFNLPIGTFGYIELCHSEFFNPMRRRSPLGFNPGSDNIIMVNGRTSMAP